MTSPKDELSVALRFAKLAQLLPARDEPMLARARRVTDDGAEFIFGSEPTQTTDWPCASGSFNVRGDLFYAGPCAFLNFCTHESSPYVTLVHDYPSYERTMLVRHP